MGSGEEESVEAAAVARRERLRALKAAQELLNTPDDSATDPPQQQDEENDNQDELNANVSMKFRNYLPHDKQLQEGKLAPPVLPKFEDPVLAAPPQEEKKEVLHEILSHISSYCLIYSRGILTVENKIQDPFLNIAPKKPNWDLRRDVQKRLDKLERRTQKAMLTLMEREEEKRRSEENQETENGGEE
ncbi:hypothetical protein ACS0TY_007244 [Phlomoides rotata]